MGVGRGISDSVRQLVNQLQRASAPNLVLAPEATRARHDHHLGITLGRGRAGMTSGVGKQRKLQGDGKELNVHVGAIQIRNRQGAQLNM